MAVRLIDFAEKKCVGGSVFRLFNDLGEYYHGTKDICIWPNREPDPDYANSNTPSSGKQDSNHQMPVAISGDFRPGLCYKCSTMGSPK